MTTLPSRTGTRPRTTPTNPHTQLNDIPEPSFSALLLKKMAALPDVELAFSQRAPEGTFGAFLKAGFDNGPTEAFLLPREFAHLHSPPDASYHLTLPEPLRSEAIERGWAEPHPLAGRHPTVSPNIVMVYAPRTLGEVDTVFDLVTASYQFARGN